jgi:hypothetical protein
MRQSTITFIKLVTFVLQFHPKRFWPCKPQPNFLTEVQELLPIDETERCLFRFI